MILDDDEEGDQSDSRSIDTSEELDFEEEAPRLKLDARTKGNLSDSVLI